MSSTADKNLKKAGKTGSAADVKQNKRKFAIIISMTAVVLAVAAVLAILFFSGSNQNAAVDQSRFSMHYTVEASDDPYVKVLGITLRMDIDKLSSEQMIYVYKAGITSPMLSCVDDMGNTIETSETIDLMSIGPIDESAKSVTLKYDVMVGRLRNYSQSYGDFYEDLLVFSGEHVLISPYLDYTQLQQTEKYISSISFKLIADYDWKAIIPFQTPLSDDLSFTVEKPTWSVFSALNKSSFCFGQFEKQDLGVGSPVYVDRAIVNNIPGLSMEVMMTFLRYYNNLFGELPSDAPLVLLRNSTESNAVILGGVGAKGGAVSVDINTADDCMTISSTLYHLYFDSMIKAPNLRYPPNNWIYGGLSSYHVIKSGTYLSQEMKEMYSINIVKDPVMDYLDYLYFSIKEPDFLVQNPSMEGSMDQVQGAFYMDIKVPVLLDLVDYAIENTTGETFISALLDMAGSENDLDIDKFLKTKCGSYYEAILRCFSGNALLPNYKDFKLDGVVSDDDIVNRLTNTDARLADLFSHGHGYIGYLSFPIILLDPDNLYRDVELMDVRYSTDEIQAEIKGFSTTLDQLLLQYAMFAKLSGYDELNYENVKNMYTSYNFANWMEYCEYVGFKYPAEQ